MQNAVEQDLQIRLFGKPEIDGSRRLGGSTGYCRGIGDAIERAKHAAGQVKSTGLNPAKRYKMPDPRSGVLTLQLSAFYSFTRQQ